MSIHLAKRTDPFAITISTISRMINCSWSLVITRSFLKFVHNEDYQPGFAPSMLVMHSRISVNNIWIKGGWILLQPCGVKGHHISRYTRVRLKWNPRFTEILIRLFNFNFLMPSCTTNKKDRDCQREKTKKTQAFKTRKYVLTSSRYHMDIHIIKRTPLYIDLYYTFRKMIYIFDKYPLYIWFKHLI